MNDIVNEAPRDLLIKDKKDLRAKLREGIKDTESENICSLDEAFTEIEKILKMKWKFYFYSIDQSID